MDLNQLLNEANRDTTDFAYKNMEKNFNILEAEKNKVLDAIEDEAALRADLERQVRESAERTHVLTKRNEEINRVMDGVRERLAILVKGKFGIPAITDSKPKAVQETEGEPVADLNRLIAGMSR